MRIAVYRQGEASCCLCEWHSNKGDEDQKRKRLLEHLRQFHCRVLVWRQDREVKGEKFSEYHGPGWRNDLERGR